VGIARAAPAAQYFSIRNQERVPPCLDAQLFRGALPFKMFGVWVDSTHSDPSGIARGPRINQQLNFFEERCYSKCLGYG
jgi:hypothetical protein